MPSVLYEVEAQVALITLAEPANRNPLNTVLTAELTAALVEAQRDPGVHAILLRAQGDSFCAGGDLREFQKYRERPSPEIYEEGKGTAGLFKLLATLTKPLVGAINGAALGGGCGLACACSITIASDRAKFGTTELRLGLFPLVILPAVRGAVGDRAALEMALTGAIMDAEAARALGIVTRVVPHEQLADDSLATARRIAAHSPIAIRLGMEAFRMSTGMDTGRAIDCINALRVVVFQTEDLREGATAFLEKRAPDWSGR